MLSPESVVTRADLAAALTARRERAGLSVRAIARTLGAPSGTLGDYFSGRHVPSRAQHALLRRILQTCGVTDPAELDRWEAAVARVRGSTDRRSATARPPYRGLETFGEDDAELFFGREQETEALLAMLLAVRSNPARSGAALAVVGPSGSGKSSLLRAGLLAAIRSGRLDAPGRRGWTGELTTPGADPDASALREHAPGAGTRVLVLDQLEELFTADDAAPRERWLAALAAHARAPGDTVVVLGLRADFYAVAAAEPALRPALGARQLLLGPLSDSALRAAIVAPAERVGLDVEAGLADVVLAELKPQGAAAGEAGALPLLSHALLATWERSSAGRLTTADFRAGGGIRGAVQRTAEQVYGELDDAQRALARRLFLRVVHIEAELTTTRRRAARAEFDALPPDERAALEEVTARFVARGLLTVDETSIQISHEALLTAWPRLREWVDTDRDGNLTQRRITRGANFWDAMGRGPDELMIGGWLAAADAWADAGHFDELNERERDYLDSSRRSLRESRARRRRTVRTLRGLLAAVGVLAVAAVVFAALAVAGRDKAQRAQAIANTARNDATSRQVAIESRELMRTDPALAQQLALVGYRIARTRDARSALIDASATPLVTRTLGKQGPTALTVSPDGRLAAVSRATDGSARLYALHGSGPPRLAGTLPGAGAAAQLFALRFVPGTSLLVAGGQAHTLTVWDVADPARPRRVAQPATGFDAATEALSATPLDHGSALLLAGGSGKHPVAAWRLTAAGVATAIAAPAGVPAGATIQSVAVSPDRRTFAAGGSSGQVLVWHHGLAAAPQRLSTGTSTVDAVAFAPRGGALAAGDRYGALRVWPDAGAGRPHVTGITSHGQIDSLAYDPTGDRLAAGSSDGTVTQWSTATLTTAATLGGPGPVTGITYTDGGARVLTASADGALRGWPTESPQLAMPGPSFASVFDADGGELALGASGTTGAAQVWDTRRSDQPRPIGPPDRFTDGPVAGTAALSRDGRLLAAGSASGKVQLWHVTSHGTTMAGPPFAAATALIESLFLSPSGRLLAVGSDDNHVYLWDVADPAHPRRVAVLATHGLVLGIGFSPDGRLLAAADSDETGYLWGVADPAHPHLEARLRGFHNYDYGVTFSPDSRLLAVGSADRTTRLFDVSHPARPRPLGSPLTGPTDYVYSVSFSPDGHTLAASSNDGTVWMYDVRHPAHPSTLATLRSEDGALFTTAFSPSGDTLVAGGRAPAATTWTVNVRGYARALCSATGTPITASEWREYVPDMRYAPPCG